MTSTRSLRKMAAVFNKSLMLVFGVCAAVMAPAYVVQAQSSTAGGLEEIVVTAEKRESTVQKTPITEDAPDQRCSAQIADRG